MRDARQRPHLLEQRPVERHDRFRLRVLRLGRTELERQHALGLEAEVDVHQRVEALQHQARAEQKHDRDRHLRAREHPPQARAPRARRLPAAPRRAATRRGSGAASGRPGAKPKRKVVASVRAAAKTSIPASIPIGVSAGRPAVAPRGEDAHARPRERQAQRGPRAGEDEALGQELARQPRLAGADRGAHGDLALAALGARRAAGWRRWRRPSA